MELVGAVEAAGLACWVAPRDVAPGADWAAEIVDAIATARVMVLVFSASANTSPQVRREVERAVHREVRVLPFRVAHILPTGSLEYFLGSQHWFDAFPPPMQPHYARLCAYLKTLLTESAPTPTAPESPPSEAELKRLERELARYIGPIARHLVQRAARRAAGTEALILELGAEIESETERRQFISAGRLSLRRVS